MIKQSNIAPQIAVRFVESELGSFNFVLCSDPMPKLQFQSVGLPLK